MTICKTFEKTDDKAIEYLYPAVSEVVIEILFANIDPIHAGYRPCARSARRRGLET